MARLMRLGLFGICAVAASASREAGDSVVLAQWNFRVYRARPAALEAEPADGAAHEVPTPAPERSFMDILQDLPDILNKTLGDKNSKSTGPGGQGDQQDMMRVMNIIMDAVKSDAFMHNVTWLIQDMVAETKDYIEIGKAALDKYAFWSRTAQDKEMPSLTVWFFNNITNGTLAMQKHFEKAFNATKGVIPSELREMMDSAKQGGNSKDQSASAMALMPVNSSRAEVCRMADIRLADLGKYVDGSQKGMKMVNATHKMLPMMKNYLTSMRPEVAVRMLWLVEFLMNNSYSMMSESADFVESVVEEATPVIKARMGCKFSSSSSCRAGLGFLALALLVVTRLEL